jgi:biopolymer transport protein ExbD
MPQPYGLVAVFGVLAVLMALVNSDLLRRKPPMGILALTTSRDLKAIGFDPWLKPLVLRIDAKNRWFPDGEPVTPDNFPGTLRKSLSRRPDWFVYLEADPGLDFGVPARAMDMIQGLYAKVILMVPTAPRITGR